MTNQKFKKKKTAQAREKLKDTELNGVDRTHAVKIVIEMDMTSPAKIDRVGDREIKFTFETDGGFCAFGSGTNSYGIKSVTGGGETVTVRLVKKPV